MQTPGRNKGGAEPRIKVYAVEWQRLIFSLDSQNAAYQRRRVGRPNMTRGGKQLIIVGGWLAAIGAILLVISVGAFADREVSSRLALREFDAARTVAVQANPNARLALPADAPVDFNFWSAKRILDYKKSLTRKGSPVAVLRFQKLDLRIPVFEGTDELTLNRGAGWIAGTAKPGEAGNIGVAGHRDGFFRRLRDAEVGDVIELATVDGTAIYTVDQIVIVDPADVSVLRPRGVPSLTLVTCYPFFFAGVAPQRFIVHAALKVMSNT